MRYHTIALGLRPDTNAIGKTTQMLSLSHQSAARAGDEFMQRSTAAKVDVLASQPLSRMALRRGIQVNVALLAQDSCGINVVSSL